MARWISQSEVRSITGITRQRTAYLRSLFTEVVPAIQSYVAASPDGEEVTLAVLQAVGRHRLESVDRDRSFGRLKQDMGLLVAQTLVDLYGATQVETLRRKDGKSVSTRRNTWPDLDWVHSFAPHRIQTHARRPARILLDTVLVRKIVYGDTDVLALDVGGLCALKGDHPVSIADGAVAELSAALLRGAVSTSDWSARIGLLDELLDADFPIAPGGQELASLWGAEPNIGTDLAESKAYHRAVWSYLRGVQSPEDLTRPVTFHAPSGRPYLIQLHEEQVGSVLKDSGERWTSWVDNVASLIGNVREAGEVVTEARICDLMRNTLAIQMGIADSHKLDLIVHVMARRALQAATGKTPYSPKGSSNDPLDLDLLYAIPLPGWICTADMHLHRLVHSTSCPDRNMVMTPVELMAKLHLSNASDPVET